MPGLPSPLTITASQSKGYADRHAPHLNYRIVRCERDVEAGFPSVACALASSRGV
jgi:hypothetical protein